MIQYQYANTEASTLTQRGQLCDNINITYYHIWTIFLK